MQFVGAPEEQPRRFALLHTNSKDSAMQEAGQEDSKHNANQKIKTVYNDEKKKYLHAFLTLINPIAMLTDMNEYLTACKRQCQKKMDGSNGLGNSHMLSVQILLKKDLCKPYIENERQAWETALILLSEHLHAEFTNR